MVGAAPFVAVPALAETRPTQPKGSSVTLKVQDAAPRAQTGPKKTKPPVGKAKPFLGGTDEGTGI